MSAKQSLIWVMFILPYLHGCGSPDLDREAATKLVLESPELNKLRQEAPITDAAHKAGQELGWWQGKYSPSWAGQTEPPIYDEIFPVQPTKMGEDFYLVRPRSPVDIKVEVDGIAIGASDGKKIIEFRWTYFGLPKFLSWVAIMGGTGQAYAQLYDDGWRIQSMSMENSAERYLTQSGEADLSDALQTARAKTAALEQEKALARKKIKERSVLSRTPTKVIKEFELKTSGNDKRYNLKFQVSDVGVVVSGYSFGKDYTHKQYFADVYKQARGAVTLDNYGRPIIVRYIPRMPYTEEDLSQQILALKNEIESAFAAWKVKFSDVVRGCRGIGNRLGCSQPAIK